MKIVKLMLAAALAFGTAGAVSAPASASSSSAAEASHDGATAAKQRRDRHWRGDRRGHRGWSNRRVCRNVWRHGHRQRVCRTVRYRR